MKNPPTRKEIIDGHYVNRDGSPGKHLSEA